MRNLSLAIAGVLASAAAGAATHDLYIGGASAQSAFWKADFTTSVCAPNAVTTYTITNTGGAAPSNEAWRCTAGSATVAGYDVFTESMDVRRNIGYLPEGNPLYPEMRAREFLNFRGKLRGLGKPERDAAIKRVTDRCWLGEFIDRPISQLSKGMKQRVGLADALLHDRRIIDTYLGLGNKAAIA